MMNADPMLVNTPHYETVDKILNSDLFDAFRLMPKPVLHMCHILRSCDPAYLVELSYLSIVYFSE